jgi:hypothetical protein
MHNIKAGGNAVVVDKAQKAAGVRTPKLDGCARGIVSPAVILRKIATGERKRNRRGPEAAIVAAPLERLRARRLNFSA